MAGRPSKFKPEFIEQAKGLCELGATDREIAHFFKVKERTVYRWILEHAAFCQALKIGKQAADDRVERSLYRKALGYSHDAVKILQNNGLPVIVPYVEHIPPDTTAAIFWLKNRKPADWRDVKAVEHTGSVTHKHVSELTIEELDQRIAALTAGEAGSTDGEKQPPELH